MVVPVKISFPHVMLVFGAEFHTIIASTFAVRYLIRICCHLAAVIASVACLGPLCYKFFCPNIAGFPPSPPFFVVFVYLELARHSRAAAEDIEVSVD